MVRLRDIATDTAWLRRENAALDGLPDGSACTGLFRVCSQPLTVVRRYALRVRCPPFTGCRVRPFRVRRTPRTRACGYVLRVFRAVCRYVLRVLRAPRAGVSRMRRPKLAGSFGTCHRTHPITATTTRKAETKVASRKARRLRTASRCSSPALVHHDSAILRKSLRRRSADSRASFSSMYLSRKERSFSSPA